MSLDVQRPDATATDSSAAAARAATGAGTPGRRATAAGVVLVAVAAAVVLSLVHLTQGTSAVGPWDIVRALVGADPAALDVLLGGRLPRLVSGVVVGVALGAAGAAMQATSRNPLASPDTLAVNAGAWFAVTLCSVFGLALGVLGFGGVAFAGGLAAAAVVIGMGGGAPMRLVLAGSAVALAVMAGTTLLMILFQQETAGLYAWGSGTLGQAGLEAASRIAPVVLVSVATLMLLAGRLDLLALGDDAASVLGLNVRRTRMTTMLVAVLLSAAAVTLAGPIGFVGLSAPVIVRLVGTAGAGAAAAPLAAARVDGHRGGRRGRLGRAAANRVRPDGRRDRPHRRADLDPRRRRCSWPSPGGTGPATARGPSGRSRGSRRRAGSS